jgi:hypothetical protein
VEETADSPFAFKVNWTFKVQEAIIKVPIASRDFSTVSAPAFQAQNLTGNTLTVAEVAEEAESQGKEMKVNPDGSITYTIDPAEVQSTLQAEMDAESVTDRAEMESRLEAERFFTERRAAEAAEQLAQAEAEAAKQQDLAKRKKAGR